MLSHDPEVGVKWDLDPNSAGQRAQPKGSACPCGEVEPVQIVDAVKHLRKDTMGDT